VLQREKLLARGVSPDVLVMTATPIPRSLAMALYGDLDVSVIDELPPGRKPVVTAVRTNERRERVYDFIRQECAAGRQAYIVYPLVEESEKLDVAAATAAAERLQQEVFPTLVVGLLHGRMKSEEKDAVMQKFVAGEIHVLVTTTVVEVGIDVPNASVMVIEHPERFGLAQLHQLRGRVGRGAAKSYCVLMAPDDLSPEALERLKFFCPNAGWVCHC
jgi:ATP-dependent DNA helicase RecG